MENVHPAERYIDRIVKLEEECRGLRVDIREVYAQAREAGHKSGAVRIVVKRKLEDEEQRASREAIETEADQIMAALGMLRDTPLGQAAVHRASTANGGEQPQPRRRGRPRKDASQQPQPDGPVASRPRRPRKVTPEPETAATPYEAGRQAYIRGDAASTCPHEAGSFSYEGWQQGWLGAFEASREARNGQRVEHSDLPPALL